MNKVIIAILIIVAVLVLFLTGGISFHIKFKIGKGHEVDAEDFNDDLVEYQPPPQYVE